MNAFKKEEKLCRQSHIDALFKSGKSFSEYPYKIIWMEENLPLPFPAQVMISVPKRNVKKAVHRNKIKRRIREAYRIHKKILYSKLTEKGKKIIFTIIYLPKEIKEFKELENKIQTLLANFPV